MSNKRYYKYNDDYDVNPIGDNFTYLEVEETAVLRQISWNGTDYIASNVIYQAYSDMVLADQPLEEPFDDNLIAITKEEFESVWQGHLATRADIWEGVKQTHSVGKHVEGALQLFFPQGVIVNLGYDALGVADHAACRASTTWENMYPKHRVTATVSGYDEDNQWIILSSPQVHSDVVKK